MYDSNFSPSARIVDAVIKRGFLRLPSTDNPNFLDLIRAILISADAELPSTHHSEKLSMIIGKPKHLIFIIVDGMGMMALEDEIVKKLRDQLVTELDSVFPATTACAMTSLATGLWPSEHGIPGWFSYISEKKLNTIVLPFIERTKGSSLLDMGIGTTAMWPYPSQISAISRDALLLHPSSINNSVFTQYSAGGIRRIGYDSKDDAIQVIQDRLFREDKPTFTFLYLPHYDNICHSKGVKSKESYAVLDSIQNDIFLIRESLPKDSKLIVTADHGLVDIQSDCSYGLHLNHPLLNCLKALPSGEPRTPHFHIKDGKIAEFKQHWSEMVGDEMILVNQHEAACLKLFGTDRFSHMAKKRFGDLIGIAIKPIVIDCLSDSNNEQKMIGRHGGMMPKEVRIPVLLFNGD